MGSRTLIGGTAYTINTGKTIVGGTVYNIANGKTLINGTAKSIGYVWNKYNKVSQTQYVIGYNSEEYFSFTGTLPSKIYAGSSAEIYNGKILVSPVDKVYYSASKYFLEWSSYPYCKFNSETIWYKMTRLKTNSTRLTDGYRMPMYVKNNGTVYVKGDTLQGSVWSSDSATYPDNGASGDYWYVKV